MTTAIATFAKTPSLSPVKTRLAKTIGTDLALKFYLLSLSAVKGIVNKVDAQPYWAIAEKDGIKNPLWADYKALYTEEGCLGLRQHYIYEKLLSEHDRVILIGSDTPQISKNLLDDAIIALDTNDFVIGPASDGGYYLFGGRLSLPAKTWTSVPWSSHLTRERLEALLPTKAHHLPTLTDVDTQQDLHLVTKEMPEEQTQEQQKVIEWIKDHERPVSMHG